MLFNQFVTIPFYDSLTVLEENVSSKVKWMILAIGLINISCCAGGMLSGYEMIEELEKIQTTDS